MANEQDNPSLKNVLPKQCARPALDKQRLGELVDLISTIGLGGCHVSPETICRRTTAL